MKKIEQTIYKLNIENPCLAEGKLNLLFITDLHETSREELALRQMATIIRKVKPDLILLGGDMIVRSHHETFIGAAGFISWLTEIAPVYYAYGNHEKKSDDAFMKMYRKTLEEHGVRFLLNEKEQIKVREIPLVIYGYDIALSYYKRRPWVHLPLRDMYASLGKPAKDQLNILLAHHPRFLKQYKDWGADITLCGHYHGGVMRLGANRGVITPDLRIMPKDAYGHFENKGKHIIISGGAGEHNIPFRFFNPREIVHLSVTINNGETDGN